MMNFNDIKNYEFKPVGKNAYRADEVDTFFAEVIIVCEKLFRENNELGKRINLLADRLNEYKKDEGDIKQAVLSAQRAADIIIRDAKASVEDCKAEADAILAAAKGEAAVIRSDAEKQAIVDSDLIISKTKDRAEDIINKAKEQAHGILIAANNSASDKVGAANRTITSETLHYDMLKKEVSEFRASILAQYKAHIELISKLPELAVEEAAKIEIPEPSDQLDISEEEIENPVFVQEAPAEDSVLEYIQGERVDDVISADAFDVDEEDVVKTTLPYEFFGDDDSQIEFISDDADQEIKADDVITYDDEAIDDGSISFARRNPIAVEEEVFSEESVDNSAFDSDTDDLCVSADDDNSADVFEDISSDSDEDEETDTDEADDIRSEYGSYSSFFDSVEIIDVEDESTDDSQNKPRGFFRKK